MTGAGNKVGESVHEFISDQLAGSPAAGIEKCTLFFNDLLGGISIYLNRKSSFANY